MTEQEAKSKWCPMVRIIITPANQTWGNKALTNRIEFVNSGGSESLCIASNCMMWRWEETKYIDDGYCGLAGKP